MVIFGVTIVNSFWLFTSNSNTICVDLVVRSKCKSSLRFIASHTTKTKDLAALPE